MRPEVMIQHLAAAAFTVPTDQPESDGTLAWTSTTLVVVRAMTGGLTSLGYTYTDASAAHLIRSVLAGVVIGRDALRVAASHDAMVHTIRNLGRPGLASTAVAAVDIALWHLKARLLDLPLVGMLGQVRDTVPPYSSGGFTSYSVERLCEQLGGWAADGMSAVKMKIGRDPAADPARVRGARQAIGPTAALFVDAKNRGMNVRPAGEILHHMSREAEPALEALLSVAYRRTRNPAARNSDQD